VTFAIELAVLAVVFLAFGANPLAYVPLLVPYMLLLGAFGLGIGLLLSVLNVYFRDVAHFVAIAMQIWFYATPVIYPPTLVAEAARSSAWVERFHVDTLYALNPMVHFVEAFRDLLYVQRLPGLATTAGLLAVAVGTLVIGLVAFSRWQGRLAEEL
jgi:ABC-2 type transport system permease protein